MRLYEKITRPDNYSKYNIPFEKGDKITIQEKLDGSNVAIFKDDKDKIRLFSRNKEITNDTKNWNKFIDYVKNFEDKIIEVLDKNMVIYGEWLGMGKLGYNTKANKKEIEPFYVFDTGYIDINSKELKNSFGIVPDTEVISYRIGLEYIPTIVKEMNFYSFEELKKKYVDNQKSLIDKESVREGIVIKTIDRIKVVKIVSEEFSEVKSKSNKNKVKTHWAERFITPARIHKYLMRLEEEGIVFKSEADYGKIFSKLDLLSEDILEEELEEVKKQVSREIKKISVNEIKEYLKEEI